MFRSRPCPCKKCTPRSHWGEAMSNSKSFVIFLVPMSAPSVPAELPPGVPMASMKPLIPTDQDEWTPLKATPVGVMPMPKSYYRQLRTATGRYFWLMLVPVAVLIALGLMIFHSPVEMIQLWWNGGCVPFYDSKSYRYLKCKPRTTKEEETPPKMI